MSLVYGDDKALGARIEKALDDTRLSTTLQASRRHLIEFRGQVEERHPDWTQRVERARAIRTDAVARAPELLDRFEAAVASRGGRVIRAATPEDALRAVLEIAQRRGVKVIAKGKTMISEEIELNPALEAAGLTPIETDLGEWIIQLAGERPSHILAPVIHRSRGQIAEVLAAHRGGPMSDDPQGMVTYSREQLRSVFLEADMGITGGNFLVAETGTVILLENEGNGRLASSLPRVHVVLAGLERVLETTADAAFMIEQLALGAVGRELPAYVSWLSGPAADGDDGPEEFVVIVLDNGRSRVRESDEREILNCIRCGSCLTVCPVYSKVGGHAYGSVYGGPIGAVLTPLLTDMKPGQGRKLPFLSSLCGACTDACPVGIPLHDLLVRDRALANRAGFAGRSERAGVGGLEPGLVEPAPVSRLGPRGRALGAVRARLRAGGELAGGARDAPAAEHEAVPPALARSGTGPVIDTFIAALAADGGQGARVADSAAARTHVAGLLGRDATLCFWEGDPLVMSLDPASLGRVAEPADAVCRHHERSVRGGGHGHARAHLRRGLLARDRPAARSAHRAPTRRSPAADTRRGDRARLRG